MAGEVLNPPRGSASVNRNLRLGHRVASATRTTNWGADGRDQHRSTAERMVRRGYRHIDNLTGALPDPRALVEEAGTCWRTARGVLKGCHGCAARARQLDEPITTSDPPDSITGSIRCSLPRSRISAIDVERRGETSTTPAWFTDVRTRSTRPTRRLGVRPRTAVSSYIERGPISADAASSVGGRRFLLTIPSKAHRRISWPHGGARPNIRAGALLTSRSVPLRSPIGSRRQTVPERDGDGTRPAKPSGRIYERQPADFERLVNVRAERSMWAIIHGDIRAPEGDLVAHRHDHQELDDQIAALESCARELVIRVLRPAQKPERLRYQTRSRTWARHRTVTASERWQSR